MKKFSLILSVIFCSSVICHSQIIFQRTIGGAGNDLAWSVKQTSDSGYITAGYTSSFGAGSDDFYIVKFSGSTIQWSRTVGGTGSDIGLSMVTGGGYTISGETDSYGAGAFDAYLIKLDDNGILQWSKTYGGAGIDYGEAVIKTSDGGYAIGGYTNSYGAGDYDMYIIKVDGGGALQWIKTIGSPGYDYALSIVQSNDGGYALCGSTAFSGAGYTDFYIVKLDSTGALQWSRTVGGSEGDYGSYIIQTADGGFVSAGVTLSYGAGEYDIYIVKLSNSGALGWTRTIGGTNFEYVYSILQTSDAGFAITGSTASYGAGGYDAYIVKLDSSGLFQWSRAIGGTGDDAVRHIVQNPDGSYTAAGETHSFGAGNFDMFIIKLDAGGNICGNYSSPIPATGTGGILGSPVSVLNTPVTTVTSPGSIPGSGGIISTICLTGIHSVSSEVPVMFKLYQNYPNPFNPITNIKFQIPNNSFTSIIVYDALGNEISVLVNEKLRPGAYEVEWNASNLSSGVYYYHAVIHSDRLTSWDPSLRSGQGFTETKKMILLK